MELPTVSLGQMRIESARVRLEHREAVHGVNLCVATVDLVVRDRDADRLIPVRLSEEIVSHHADPRTVERLVLSVVKRAVLHEVSEWLRIDGKLVEDPELMHAHPR